MPFRPSLLEAAGGPPRLAHAPYRLVGVCAERAAAVRHDLSVAGQLGEAVLELLERDRARAADVARLELLRRADVDEHDLAGPEPGDQLVAPDRLDVLAEVVARGALDLGQ